MKLVHIDFEEQFVMDPNVVNVLVVEPEDRFYEYCSEILAQIEGGDGNFCLSDGDKTLSISKSAAAVDVFALQTNEKKSILKLHAYLHSLFDEKLYAEANELGRRWAELFQKLNAESCYPIEYAEEDFCLALFKAFDVRFAEEEQSLLGRIVSYMHVWAELFRVRCFVFIHLKTMLTERELAQLYQEAALCQVNLFLLENTLKPPLKNEKVVLMDRDWCEILVQSPKI